MSKKYVFILVVCISIIFGAVVARIFSKFNNTNEYLDINNHSEISDLVELDTITVQMNQGDYLVIGENLRIVDPTGTDVTDEGVN